MLTTVINYLKTNKITVLLMVLLFIATMLLTYFVVKPKGTPKATVPNVVTDATVNQKTTVDVVPKTSKYDNDLEVSQRYKATINGATVEVPVKTVESPYGSKTVVTQEVDMTKVINSALAIERERVKEEYKKNWEIGVGIGSHNGDTYIPVELQRNYATDKAISVEVHLDYPDVTKVEGYEVMHKWKF